MYLRSKYASQKATNVPLLHFHLSILAENLTVNEKNLQTFLKTAMMNKNNEGMGADVFTGSTRRIFAGPEGRSAGA